MLKCIILKEKPNYLQIMLTVPIVNIINFKQKYM